MENNMALKQSKIHLFGIDGREKKIMGAALGTMPGTYPWREMAIGDSFHKVLPRLSMSAARRRSANTVYTAVSKFVSRNPPYAFNCQIIDNVMVVTRAN
jgi:hypothetical protein